jgi:serine/threonine protein kinase
LGSVAWAAPEYLTGKRESERSEKGDVFSFGVILWELETQKIPWRKNEKNEIIELVLAKGRLEIPACYSEDLRDLVLKCWEDGKKCIMFL